MQVNLKNDDSAREKMCIRDRLEDVSASLNQYEQLIDTFIDGNASLAKVSAETGNALNDGQDKISDGQDKLQPVSYTHLDVYKRQAYS